MLIKVVLFASSLLSFATVSSAADQSAPATPEGTDSPTLSEITVTAERRSASLQNVPIAVSVVSADRLSAAVILDTQDLAAAVPGLTFPQAFQYALPHIRGVGNTVIGPGAENSVALYVDGVYYATAAGSILSLNNASQVEVLKGPQGTLFGRNATGGLIQIATKDPSATPHVEANVGYGNFQTSTADVYATGGITDTLVADAAVQYTRQGQGWGRNIFNGTDVYKTPKDISARSKLVWTPTDSTRIGLNLDYETIKSSIGAQEAPGTDAANPFYPPSDLNYPPYTNNVNTQPLQVHQGGGVSLHIEQKMDAFDVLSITAFRRSVDYLTVDFDIGPQQLISSIDFDTDRQFSEELQLRSNGSGPLKWTAGVFYFRAQDGYAPNNVGFGGFVAPPAGPGLFITNIGTFDKQTTDSIAGYLQGTYQILPTYNLTVGLRFTHEKRSFDADQIGTINNSFTIPLLTGFSAPDLTVNKPTWRFAFDHQFSDEVMGYVSYNRGFKSGGFNAADPAIAPYQTEQLDAYELGLKTLIFDHRLRVNSALFYYNYKNIQVSKYINGNPDTYNGAAAQLYGIDMDANAALTQHLELDAGIEAMRSHFTDFACANFFEPPTTSSSACVATPTPGPPPYLRSAAGNTLPDAPRVTASVTLQYHFPLFLGEARLAVTDAFNSGYFYEPNNDAGVRQSAYNLVNASATWNSANDRYSIGLWGRNLSDTRYTIELASAPTGELAAYAAPRTYGIRMGVKF